MDHVDRINHIKTTYIEMPMYMNPNVASVIISFIEHDKDINPLKKIYKQIVHNELLIRKMLRERYKFEKQILDVNAKIFRHINIRNHRSIILCLELTKTLPLAACCATACQDRHWDLIIFYCGYIFVLYIRCLQEDLILTDLQSENFKYQIAMDMENIGSGIRLKIYLKDNI